VCVGLIFKDQIKVNAFEDPKVKGVQLYITDFERPVTERLQKNFFSDPTQA
jgi:catabolite regulation protein CreA